jgi:formamidopyrimidine-DNA glycosylase
MPELPEVETMRRGLLPCVGGRITAVSKPRSKYRPIVMSPSLATIRRRLLGRTLVDVERLGKRVLLRLDSSDTLVLQPKMAGLVLVGLPPNQAHARLVIELAGCRATPIIYWDQRGLGTVRLWNAQELQAFLNSGDLGPDALSVSFEDFYGRFSTSRRELKPTLLEQHRVAGIGNLYASEIVHRCRIDPRTPADQLSRRQWRKIFAATVAILEEAIRYEGSTLADGSYRNSLDAPGNYQNAHRVYDRSGLPCLQCKTGKIERIVQAQRSTFFCPRCQPRQ